MNMFDVKIEDTGNNPENVIIHIEKCLRAGLPQVKVLENSGER